MRVVIAAGLALFALAAGAGAAGANEYALVRARSLYNQLRDDTQCEAALPSARGFWRSSEFGTLSADARIALLSQIMRCAWSLEDSQVAISAAQAAQELGGRWAGYALLRLGVQFQDHALTLRAFHALADSDPTILAAMPQRYVWGVIRAAGNVDPSEAATLRVHDVLLEHRYADPEGAADDALRVDHARLLSASGHLDRARQRLERVTDPRQIMLLRIDRRFDALRGDAAFERRLDVVAAAEADLASARAAATATPRNLALVLGHVQALRRLGREQEALEELDRHIPRAQSPDAGSHYDNVERNLNWLLNEKAYALYELDRPEEARQAFSAAIAAGEEGHWNVSQVINFASMLTAEGRATDALEVIRVVGRASPYGDMWAAVVRACASHQLGDAAATAEALQFMEAHVDDNVAAMTHAYLCVDNLDAAAALYLRRLQSAEWRGDALLALQACAAPGGETLPHNTILLERLERVRGRQDVQAAIALVGRTEACPLASIYWGDV